MQAPSISTLLAPSPSVPVGGNTPTANDGTHPLFNALFQGILGGLDTASKASRSIESAAAQKTAPSAQTTQPGGPQDSSIPTNLVLQSGNPVALSNPAVSYAGSTTIASPVPIQVLFAGEGTARATPKEIRRREAELFTEKSHGTITSGGSGLSTPLSTQPDTLSLSNEPNPESPKPTIPEPDHHKSVAFQPAGSHANDVQTLVLSKVTQPAPPAQIQIVDPALGMRWMRSGQAYSETPIKSTSTRQASVPSQRQYNVQNMSPIFTNAGQPLPSNLPSVPLPPTPFDNVNAPDPLISFPTDTPVTAGVDAPAANTFSEGRDSQPLSLRSSWFQLPDMSLNNAKTKNTIHTGEVISANGQAAHARNPLAREQESPQSSASLETEAGGSPVEAMITVQSLRSTVTDSPENDVEHDPSPRATDLTGNSAGRTRLVPSRAVQSGAEASAAATKSTLQPNFIKPLGIPGAVPQWHAQQLSAPADAARIVAVQSSILTEGAEQAAPQKSASALTSSSQPPSFSEAGRQIDSLQPPMPPSTDVRASEQLNALPFEDTQLNSQPSFGTFSAPDSDLSPSPTLPIVGRPLNSQRSATPLKYVLSDSLTSTQSLSLPVLAQQSTIGRAASHPVSELPAPPSSAAVQATVKTLGANTSTRRFQDVAPSNPANQPQPTSTLNPSSKPRTFQPNDTPSVPRENSSGPRQDQSANSPLTRGADKAAMADAAPTLNASQPNGPSAEASSTPAPMLPPTQPQLSNSIAKPTTDNPGIAAQNSQAPTATDNSSTVSAARILDRNGQTEIKIEMQDRSLGFIQLRAHITGDQIGASIAVEHHDAQVMLNSELPALHSVLSEKNIQVDIRSVSQGSMASMNSGPGGESGYRGFSQTYPKSPDGGQQESSNIFPSAHHEGADGVDSAGGLSVRA